MSELTLVWLVPIRLLIIAGFSLFYIIGGRSNKAVRRIGASIWLSLTVMILAFFLGIFKWWLVFMIPAYMLALWLGYGGNNPWLKLLRRASYGLILGACCLIVASVRGMWALAGFQMACALISSVYLGLMNPVEAVNEEALISILSVVTVPFMI